MEQSEQIFIDQLIKTQKPVTLFMTNGVKLSGGTISRHDGRTIYYLSRGFEQLVYKHAAGTIVPAEVEGNR